MNGKSLLIFLLVVGTSCSAPGGASKINLLEKTPIQPRDTVTQGMYDGRYFSPYVIRLGARPAKGFVKVDSLPLPASVLTKNTREAWYQQVISLLPKDELAVYHLVWGIPEIVKLQMADGGYGSLVARIRDRPDAQSPSYVVELLRNDIEQWPRCREIAFLKIQLQPQKIELATESEYYVSLDRWRKEKSR